MFHKTLKSLKNKVALLSIATVAMFGLALMPAPAHAKACTADGPLGFPTWSRGLNCEDRNGHEVVEETSIPKVIWTIALNILDVLLHIAGIIAIFMILISAFKYLVNGGSQQRIASAKSSLLKAVIGLAIAFLSSTIVGFIVSGLTGGW